jgi:hypothetical protein
VLSFLPGSNKYLQTLKAGSKVYVEAAYEIREPEVDADPSTPQGQRQIFLRHGAATDAIFKTCLLIMVVESIKVISGPKGKAAEGGEEEHMQ